ncbi:MAG: energy-coupling factor ABC transporter permease [Spirochaetaceae bacterium]|nr:energy-coupling factor ABC transporter permease [Spirochaetaceae bacterium]
MHMADALLSPAVGGILWTAALSAGGYSVRKIRNNSEENKNILPLTGIAAAFIFAAQMINFTIPGTGSSGHLGGGLFLAILLGPHAAILGMTVILLIQSLFFADGGLLALGANIINMGFLTCFIAYPLIYKPLTARNKSQKAIFGASMAAAVIGLQMGSFGVVVETFLSGRTELPFTAFILLMQPIHLAIGLVEGFLTGALVLYIYRNAPEILNQNQQRESIGIRKVLPFLAILAILCGGVFSWFASVYPDGLEWSIEKTAGTAELEIPPGGVHEKLQSVQDFFAFLPDYGFRNSSESERTVQTETSISGITGSIFTLLVISAVIMLTAGFKYRKRNKPE